MMEWEYQPPSGGGGLGGGIFVKVMTDDQMQVLRKQIAAYAIICEPLAELHKTPNDLAGMHISESYDYINEILNKLCCAELCCVGASRVRLGNLYCDPLITSGAHKMSGRQLWTPTPTQLQILERVFDNTKQAEDQRHNHGQISETDVYNWFQNRRARSKRKQQATTPSANNNGESEVETEEVDSPKEKNMKPEEEFQPQRPILSSRASEDQLCFQNPQPDESKSHEPLMPRSSGDLGQMLFYGGMDQFMGKIQVPGNYSPYMQQDDYNLEG